MQQLYKQLAKTSHKKDVRAALLDLEYETTNCAAFYQLTYAGAVQAGATPADVKKLHMPAEATLRLAYQLAQLTGMSADALEAQYKFDTESIMKETHNTWVDFPIVIQKHAGACKELLERTDLRLTHWLKVERENGARARSQK